MSASDYLYDRVNDGLRTIEQLHTADDGGCTVCGTPDECVTRAEAIGARAAHNTSSSS